VSDRAVSDRAASDGAVSDRAVSGKAAFGEAASGGPAFDTEQLRAMSREERLSLLRTLAAMDCTEPPPDPDPAIGLGSSRRRTLALVAIVVCCIVLAGWIAVLALTLPRHYRSGGWRGAWVGFDLALLAAFAITGWAAWRRRQVLIICLVVLATLRCCDAWFDVVLDARTKGFLFALLTALFIELPLAGFAIAGARRLLRLSIGVIRRYEGLPGPVPRLRRVGLVTGASGPRLVDLFHAGRPTEGQPAEGPHGPAG
jgi:hypothetical protein